MTDVLDVPVRGSIADPGPVLSLPVDELVRTDDDRAESATSD